MSCLCHICCGVQKKGNKNRFTHVCNFKIKNTLKTSVYKYSYLMPSNHYSKLKIIIRRSLTFVLFISFVCFSQ